MAARLRHSMRMISGAAREQTRGLGADLEPGQIDDANTVEGGGF